MQLLGGSPPRDAPLGVWPGFVFDTETTGVDVGRDRVVELGAIGCEAGAAGRERKMRIDPGVPIPAEASKIHGIYDEHVRGKPSFAAIAGRFVEYLTGQAQGHEAPWLCGYNAAGFDVPLLNAELMRAGLEVRIDASQVVDPMVFVRWHLRHLRSRSLESACQHLGIPLLRAHSALDDATATLRLLLVMMQRGLVPATLGEVLAEQTRISRLMQAEWEQYSYWLYHDRSDGKLRLGAGSYCGRYLGEVSHDYLQSLIKKVADLPDKVRATFLQQAAA
jgi:DNA polymerase III epsilon subunit family exonuclease